MKLGEIGRQAIVCRSYDIELASRVLSSQAELALGRPLSNLERRAGPGGVKNAVEMMFVGRLNDRRESFVSRPGSHNYASGSIDGRAGLRDPKRAGIVYLFGHSRLIQ
ncbi:MAG TPA: hypothetical protein VKZ79_00615 [Alphaproteobacteria bacterium]|nr:hypothetical protein [Alphaproteobacteria bacterium]